MSENNIPNTTSSSRKFTKMRIEAREVSKYADTASGMLFAALKFLIPAMVISITTSVSIMAMIPDACDYPALFTRYVGMLDISKSISLDTFVMACALSSLWVVSNAIVKACNGHYKEATTIAAAGCLMIVFVSGTTQKHFWHAIDHQYSIDQRINGDGVPVMCVKADKAS